MKQILKHDIYADFTEETVIVYQAYNTAIGRAAAAAGTLDVPGFSLSRMTWIKPSYLWMMYRCGWGRKDANQAVVLRITLDRETFAALLDRACLSSFNPDVYQSQEAWKADLALRPNRVQWDPERDLHHAPLDRRAIQLGIAGAEVGRFLEGIRRVEDITAEAQEVEALVQTGALEAAQARLPIEEILVTRDMT